MRQRDIDKIKKDAAAKYDGDLDVAIAAHLMGDVVIQYCAGQIPAGADHDTIAAIRKEIKSDAKPPRMLGAGKPAAKKPAAAPPKKPVAAAKAKPAATKKKRPAGKRVRK